MEILNASATQTNGERGKSKWIVKTSSGSELYELSAEMTEKQAMECIHMSRRFAKDGFSEGVSKAESKHKLHVESIMNTGQSQVDMLNERIAGLSTELLRLMEEEAV